MVHLIPWDLTIGGAQRMLDIWCSGETERWDTHILTNGEGGPFPLAGATIHPRLGRHNIRTLLAALRPDLLVHHDPTIDGETHPEYPQVWIMHCVRSFDVPPVADAVPAAVFASFAPAAIAPAWRRFPLRLLHLGIDLNVYRPVAVPEMRDGLFCGIVGRLHEDKVPPSFLAALADWQPGSWHIRFIGHRLDTGYQREARRKLASLPWIEFLGDVPPDRMPSALRERWRRRSAQRRPRTLSSTTGRAHGRR